MTAKEKAEELFKKYIELSGIFVGDYESEKEMCLIAVDEIINGIERGFDEYEKATGNYVKNRIFYWDFYSDVKSEIYKL
jgi:hypothetical protein